jgi:hypothetical protein
MRTPLRRTFPVLIGLLVAGCGGMTAMPTEPVNLTGTWSGVIGQGANRSPGPIRAARSSRQRTVESC